MTEKITMDREYTTRDGRKVTLYCVDAPGPYPVHGRIEGFDTAKSWTQFGRKYGGMKDETDLIPAPRVWWVNVYEDGFTTAFSTSKGAKSAARMSNRALVACVRVTEGEGL